MYVRCMCHSACQQGRRQREWGTVNWCVGAIAVVCVHCASGMVQRGSPRVGAPGSSDQGQGGAGDMSECRQGPSNHTLASATTCTLAPVTLLNAATSSNTAWSGLEGPECICRWYVGEMESCFSDRISVATLGPPHLVVSAETGNSGTFLTHLGFRSWLPTTDNQKTIVNL